MNDFDDLTSFESLYDAHRKSRRGKLWKDSVASYDMRALECTLYLQKIMRSGKYKMGGYHTFRLVERGKLRTIKSTRYVDRVVLRSLCDNVLVPLLQPTFIAGNGASQKGKGTDYMRIRLRDDMRDYFHKHGSHGYILVGDYSKYFDSIRHEYLDSLYERKIDDARVVELLRHIHSTTDGGIGLPLGNQTSQLDALLAADAIDHFVKERLHIKYYGRYMDDFYLIHADKAYLQECMERIRDLSAEIGLTLNSQKTYITTLRNGINYLGFHFFMSKTGKVVVKAIKDKCSKERQRLKKLKAKVDAGELPYEKVQESYQSWRSCLSARRKNGEKRKFRPDTYYMLLRMDSYFYALFDQYLTPQERARKLYVDARASKIKEKRKGKQ